MYDVCELEEYQKHASRYLAGHTAIIKDGYLYPVLSPNQKTNECGVIVSTPISFYNPPKKGEEEKYSKEHMIDFSDSKDIASMIDKLDAVKKLESDVLTSVDNIFAPKIKAEDTPEMVALKTAVIKKHIDLDKYEHRFAENYNNDKRLFNKSTISLGKMKTIANALDMDITLTIKDVPDAPNPIGEVIEVKLTGCDANEGNE